MILLFIGYRGVGKTSVAARVAERLGMPWADADVELERRAGRSIADIFAAGGEAEFRELESGELARLLKRDSLVLATGGGVVLREENRRAIQRLRESGRGRAVWLTADPATIQRRIAADQTTAGRRPNLTAAGGLDEIVRLLEQREPVYRQCADLEIDTEKKSVDEIAKEVMEWCGGIKGMAE